MQHLLCARRESAQDASLHACAVVWNRTKCSPSSRKRARPDFLPTMLASVWEVLSDAGYVLDGSREAAGWCVRDGIRETEEVVNGDGDGDGQTVGKGTKDDLAREPMDSHVLM
jgi:hypothetical protein